MNMKLSHTLYSGFGLLLIISVVLTLIVWKETLDTKSIAKEVQNDDVPGLVQYVAVRKSLSSVKASAMEYLHRQTEAKAEFQSGKAALQEAYRKLVPLENIKDSDKEKMRKIEQLFSGYLNVVEAQVFSRYRPEDESWVKEELNKYIDTTGKDIETLLDTLKQEEFDEALLSADLAESIGDDLPGVRYYLELVDEIGDMQMSLVKYVGGDMGQKAAFEKDRDTFKEYLAKLRPLEQKPSDIANFQQIDAALSELETLAQEIFSRYDSSARSNAIKAMQQAEKDYLLPLEEILNVSADEEQADSGKGLDSLVSSMDFIVTLLLVNCAAVMVIGIAIAMWITGSVGRRLGTVMDKARGIAAGNLTLATLTDDRGDEISHVSNAVNDMQSNLRNLIGQIQQVSSEVRSTSQSVEQLSSELDKGSQEQADKSQMIAAAVEEMAASVDEVSHQSHDAADAAQLAGDNAQQGGKLMQRTVDSINKISRVVNDTSTTVVHLGKRSDEIGTVISVITDIAEQTNLLALNAAIEAARAGELGRGFAVVADEVRGLAERTSRATKDVSNLITSIQQETQLAVSRTQEGTVLVDEGVKLANEAGQALHLIVERSLALNNMVHAIAAASNEQSKATQEISRDITAISDIAQHAVQLNRNGAAAVNALDKGVQRLDQLLGQFRL
ncbi:methyl-accepting chemotaxis protein [Shewanella sp. JM162201]|uniref:Methyl-accepting chemotaxis protein n=1 Tax=Shewanella jiangmenensis TaxID=2837387 RepID=A0ABS5VA15_9GAMM|nr:methyl-accepting chemotaxis protein [Shewanella jiangmenensis]MBT1445873.1 methyl-accepting chemotaxis protein [Shewanella jiangmenensis]